MKIKFRPGDLVYVDSYFSEMGFTDPVGTVTKSEGDGESDVYLVMFPNCGSHWFNEEHLGLVSKA